MPFRFPRATVAIVPGASALVPLMGNDLATKEMRDLLHKDPTPATLEALRKAIADGADIHSPMRMFPHPKTPLAFAVEMRNAAVVRFLLDAGAKVDSQASGAPPDQGASYTCDFSALMDAVWPDLNNLMDGLFTGPERGSLAMVRLLCKRGADPNAGTNFGDTPLMLAVETGQPVLVAELLKWGADPTRRRPRGGRALEMVPLFIPPSQVGPHPLRDPCTALRVDHLNKQKGQRKEPVALAGAPSQASPASGAGAPSPVPPVERKETGFDRLVKAGQKRQADQLLLNTLVDLQKARQDEAEFGPDEQNWPLQSLDLALSQGAGVNLATPFGVTPLMAAVRAHDLAFAGRLLEEKGIDLERSTPTGRTALMLAAGRGDADMLKLLLDQGAYPLRKDPRGDRAVDLAPVGSAGWKLLSQRTGAGILDQVD